MKSGKISIIADAPFINALINKGAEVFLVGGIVRDHFLGIESKDIDLVVRNLEIEKIIEVVQGFGKCTETTVADKMGILKFMPKGHDVNGINIGNEDVDIALPRTEKLMTKSEIVLAGIKNLHNAFIVNSDPKLSIEDDLKRRDFTINSIAINLGTGDIHDPFNGIQDLENKIIRHTNEKAFADDPLRMFRAVQFVSRFDGFKIADDTFNMIIENASKAKTIAGERVHDELLKIFKRGNINKGLKILRDSGLHSELFKKRITCSVNTIKTLSDFFFHICGNEKMFTRILKGDSATGKGIRAIEFANSVFSDDTVFHNGWDKAIMRQRIFDAIQTSETVLDSGKLIGPLNEVAQEFKEGKFPKSLKELGITGKDLLETGMKPGKEMGEKIKFCLSQVFQENVKNIKSDLLEICAEEKA